MPISGRKTIHLRACHLPQSSVGCKGIGTMCFCCSSATIARASPPAQRMAASGCAASPVSECLLRAASSQEVAITSHYRKFSWACADMEEAAEGPCNQQHVGELPGAVVPSGRRGRGECAQTAASAPHQFHQPGRLDPRRLHGASFFASQSLHAKMCHQLPFWVALIPHPHALPEGATWAIDE